MKTLKEKIEVMQAALDGKEIEIKNKHDKEWRLLTGDNKGLMFTWGEFDFRIKQEPMEFWVNTLSGMCSTVHITKKEALRVTGNSQGWKTIKVIEVTEE